MHAFQAVGTCFITIFVTVRILISRHLKKNFRFTTLKDTILCLADSYSTALYTTLLPTFHVLLYIALNTRKSETDVHIQAAGKLSIWKKNK